MRDLQKDLEICNTATQGPWVFEEYDVDIWSQADPWRVANVGLHADMEFISEAREGWPHAIERAIQAEAEVERLRENLCGACESLTQATGHGWKDTCCNCEWYKTDRVTRESEGE